MATRWFALGTGIFYACLGVMGFFPDFTWLPEMPRLRMDDIAFHGAWLGGFLPINWPHNILWIVLGASGIIAFSTHVSSKLYSQAIFGITAILAVVGVLPLGIATLWGFLPLLAWNVLIHTSTAVLAWYYGCVYGYEQELRMAR